MLSRLKFELFQHRGTAPPTAGAARPRRRHQGSAGEAGRKERGGTRKPQVAAGATAVQGRSGSTASAGTAPEGKAYGHGGKPLDLATGPVE